MSQTPYQMALQIDSGILPSEKIQIELRSATQRLSEWIIDTRDTAIRESLIRMGWVPPNSDDKLPMLRDAAKRGAECGCRNCLDCSAFHVHEYQERFTS